MDSEVFNVQLDHEIWDYLGIKRCSINGLFTKNELIQKLTDEWVQYYECHKCGRVENCKYVEWRKPDLKIAKDIQCGVAVTAITNITNYTFDLLANSNDKEKQDWLDGAYHLSMFIYKAELQVGNIIDVEVLEHWEDMAPVLFGNLTRLREHLDGVAHYFRNFKVFRSTEKVLFVEGWSEKAFIDRMKGSGFIWFLYFRIEVYGGKGNGRPKRIQMLMNNFADRGFEIYFQCDADGKANYALDPIIKKCNISKENTFTFKFDFETAIPPLILLHALQSLGELESVCAESFCKAIDSNKLPVGKFLLDVHGLDINPLKMELATATADLLNASRGRWSSDDVFIQTELGRFLRFIQSI